MTVTLNVLILRLETTDISRVQAVASALNGSTHGSYKDILVTVMLHFIEELARWFLFLNFYNPGLIFHIELKNIITTVMTGNIKVHAAPYQFIKIYFGG